MDEQNQNSQQQKANALAVISYIGPLCLIPFLTQEKDEDVKFHAKQGLVLFIGEILTWVLLIIPFFWIFGWIINLGWFVLSILGIMNALKNEKKELPIVGSFAGKIKF